LKYLLFVIALPGSRSNPVGFKQREATMTLKNLKQGRYSRFIMGVIAKLPLLISTLLLMLPNIGEAFGFTTPLRGTFGSFAVRRGWIESAQVGVGGGGVGPLYMGWFDFNPIRGSGSGKNKDLLDEEFEAQQAVLRARQQQGFTKDNLMKKYGREKIAEEKTPVKPAANEESTDKGVSVKLPWEK
jgi:hypothetical protein